MKKQKLSKRKQHKLDWQDCDACELCETRRRVVLYRGKIPCDMLFIGEAPGKSEDVIGQPFVGPAGHLLDKMIADAVPEGMRIGFTNLIACLPVDPEGKVNAPHKDHIHACGDRLKEIVRIAKPKAIIRVGKLAQRYVDKILGHEDHGEDLVYGQITHPAAILRADEGSKSLAIQQTIVRLSDLSEDLIPFR